MEEERRLYEMKIGEQVTKYKRDTGALQIENLRLNQTNVQLELENEMIAGKMASAEKMNAQLIHQKDKQIEKLQEQLRAANSGANTRQTGNYNKSGGLGSGKKGHGNTSDALAPQMVNFEKFENRNVLYSGKKIKFLDTCKKENHEGHSDGKKNQAFAWDKEQKDSEENFESFKKNIMAQEQKYMYTKVLCDAHAGHHSGGGLGH